MSKIDRYRQVLRSLDDWDAFLMDESGLPGPRANLELVQAVADEGDLDLFQRYLTYDPIQAPTNSPQVFLAVCGAVGLGKILAEGEYELFEPLRQLASDPRWRMREAVCMALQRLGEVDMDALIGEMLRWSGGNPLEQRAAAAALCEPKLLVRERHAGAVLEILDEITESFPGLEDRREEAVRVLRKGLGYCWSVAVVALPEEGKTLMEKWFASRDKDIVWIMKENLKKNRLLSMDPIWVERWTKYYDSRTNLSRGING
jgi:hypothetical protein